MSPFLHLFRRFRSIGRRLPSPRGFTLIELLVVSLIIVIITTFILFQQSRFNSSTLLRSLAYSVALSVREAQVYGTSVRESATGSGIFARGYGVYFPPPGGSTYQYYLFSDNDGDGAYDIGEELPVYTLGRGYALSRFCATLSGGGSEHCSTGTSPTIDDLTIFFRRPNPEACFASSQAPGACLSGAGGVYQDAYIQLRSTGSSGTRTVRVTSTGQISVCAPNITDLSAC